MSAISARVWHKLKIAECTFIEPFPDFSNVCTVCVCVCVFPAKTGEMSCPDNLISELQSVSSNNGLLQGGGMIYLSFTVSLGLAVIS